MKSAKDRVVFLSAFQDYRTKKRASVQQVADGAKELGYDVWFVSTRYSWLSKLTGDSRVLLDNKANSVEDVNGVNCLLWKTPIHPFATKNKAINKFMGNFFKPYSFWPNDLFDDIIRGANYIVIESSVAAIFLPRINKLNPLARVIYYATDRLDTVGTHPIVQKQLISNSAMINHASLRSARMAEDFIWLSDRLYLAEFGINLSDFSDIGPSPYGSRPAFVSVGSMLFDRYFFEKMPPLFPDIDFHVIGCGENFSGASNLYVYDEMAFRDTLPFIKHATVGIAPYRPAPGVEYLADSSLKLAQYELFALPAICPNFAVGERIGRCGYTPGNVDSMRLAINHALSLAGTLKPRSFLNWNSVADRILNPERFEGIRINLSNDFSYDA